MSTNSTLFGAHFGQVAWVVPDIQAAEDFFHQVIGTPAFMRLENIRADENGGTYYGKPGDYVFHLSLAYSGDTMIELIQPVSGRSIYSDFLEKNPAGGVQHVAYMVPEDQLEQAVAQLSAKGYSIVQTLRLPVANVAYFDTPEIGVMTEIIGVTQAGVELVGQLKGAVV